jgi:hypothetical protein
LLERVRCHALSDVVVAVLANVEGMLAVEEGHAHEAIGRLEQSLNGFKTIRTPVVGTVNAQTHGYLALAHAVCGDHEAAARHFRLAEPRLRALRQDDLLARCRQTIRLPMG